MTAAHLPHSGGTGTPATAARGAAAQPSAAPGVAGGDSRMPWLGRLPPPWGALARLIRLDRPVGIALLLWPTLWALWLAAEGPPPRDLVLIFVLGVVLTRSAGCAINDYADRWLDPHVERTRSRPLASGELSGRAALITFAVLMSLAFVLVLLTNVLTIALSVAALLLAAIYPYAKRYTYYPQVLLGAAFGFGIPMAFAAVTGHVPALAWLLWCGHLLWTCAYDTEYAMVDREDDLKRGARSTAILFGDVDRHAIAILLALTLLSFVLVGQRAGLGVPYWAALVLAGLGFGLQLWWIRGRRPEACLRAFRSNQWVGLLLFLGTVTSLPPFVPASP